MSDTSGSYDKADTTLDLRAQLTAARVRAEQAESALAEAQQRREETVAMCEQLRLELAEAQRELASCSRAAAIHSALATDWRERCEQAQRERDRLATIRDALTKAGLDGLETLEEQHPVRVMIEGIVEMKTEALRARLAKCVKALQLYLQTYAHTQHHPTTVEEAECIRVVSAALDAQEPA